MPDASDYTLHCPQISWRSFLADRRSATRDLPQEAVPVPAGSGDTGSVEDALSAGGGFDAQTAYAVPELRAVGLHEYFDPIVISGDYGYRKPIDGYSSVRWISCISEPIRQSSSATTGIAIFLERGNWG